MSICVGNKTHRIVVILSGTLRRASTKGRTALPTPRTGPRVRLISANGFVTAGATFLKTTISKNSKNIGLWMHWKEVNVIFLHYLGSYGR